MEFISYLLGWFSGLFVGIAIGDYFVQEFKNQRLQKLYETFFSPTMINFLYDYIKVYYPNFGNLNVGVRSQNSNNVPNFNGFNFGASARGAQNETESNKTQNPQTESKPNTDL